MSFHLLPEYSCTCSPTPSSLHLTKSIFDYKVHLEHLPMEVSTALVVIMHPTELQFSTQHRLSSRARTRCFSSLPPRTRPVWTTVRAPHARDNALTPEHLRATPGSSACLQDPGTMQCFSLSSITRCERAHQPCPDARKGEGVGLLGRGSLWGACPWEMGG